MLAALERTRQAVASLPQNAEKIRSQFMRFSDLWTRPMAEALQVKAVYDDGPANKELSTLSTLLVQARCQAHGYLTLLPGAHVVCLTHGYRGQPGCVRCMQDFMEGEGVLGEDGTRNVPSLDKFEAKIASVHAVEADVQAMPSTITEGLLHIDTQPLKQSLVVLVSKWIYLYTQSLQQRVRLTEPLLESICTRVPCHTDKQIRCLSWSRQ